MERASWDYSHNGEGVGGMDWHYSCNEGVEQYKSWFIALDAAQWLCYYHVSILKYGLIRSKIIGACNAPVLQRLLPQGDALCHKEGEL